MAKMSSEMELAGAAMTGAAKHRPQGKPAKVVKRIEYEKAADGTHVFTHHHTRPEHHPPEEHHFKPKGGAGHHDAAVDHFIRHAIPANPGENEGLAGAGPPEAEPEPAGAGPGENAAPPQPGE